MSSTARLSVAVSSALCLASPPPPFARGGARRHWSSATRGSGPDRRPAERAAPSRAHAPWRCAANVSSRSAPRPKSRRSSARRRGSIDAGGRRAPARLHRQPHPLLLRRLEPARRRPAPHGEPRGVRRPVRASTPGDPRRALDHRTSPGTTSAGRERPLPTPRLDRRRGRRPSRSSSPRLDGHMALANSRALALAAASRRRRTTRDGGAIVRDPATGEPTGVLKEDSAMDLVFAIIPPPSPRRARRRPSTRRWPRRRALGVTSVRSTSATGRSGRSWPSGRSTSRRAPRASSPCGSPSARRSRSGRNSAISSRAPRRDGATTWLSLGGFKGYVDGSLGSTTAIFFEPYADAPETSGLFAERQVPRGRARAPHRRRRRAPASRSRSTPSASAATPPSSTSTSASRRPTVRATAGCASSTRSTCGRPRSRASPASEWSPRCSRTTSPTTAAGPTSASAPSAHATPTSSARCSTPAPTSPSAPTGRSRRSTRCSASPPRSPAGPSTARTRAAGIPEQKISVAEALGRLHLRLRLGRLRRGRQGDVSRRASSPTSSSCRTIRCAVAPEKLETVHAVLTVVGGRIVFDLAAARCDLRAEASCAPQESLEELACS